MKTIKRLRRLRIFFDVIAWFVVEGVKEAMDDAMGRRVVGTCKRKAPHVCTEDGPCNGWPRVK